MASRKTYFGIGLPKDPTDPASAPDNGDQSSPTVVDDDKVAESLKQLRSWYQSDGPEDETKRVVAQPAPAMNAVPPQPRPTAVGHATGDTPMHTQRPVAPDPMRATMFGHDIHRFDLDLPRAPADAWASTDAASPVLDGPSVNFPDSPPQPTEARPRAQASAPGSQPADPSLPDGSRLVEYLRRQAAQQQPRAAWVSPLDDTGVHAATSARAPAAAAIVFGLGVAALAAATALWIGSRDSSPAMPAPAQAAPALPSTGIERLPPRLTAPPAVEQPRDVAPGHGAEAVEPTARTTSRPAAALPRPALLTGSPAKQKRRPVPAKADEQAPADEDSASSSTDQRPAGQAPPETAASPTDSEGTAADGATAPRPTQVPRRAKAADRPRSKSPIGGDADATLPPSAGD